jgi:lipid-A-disaccharide synthase
VNINLNREAVAEIVRKKIDIEDVVARIAAILPGGAERERMLKDFDTLKRMMGEEGASLRFAEDIVKSLQ